MSNLLSLPEFDTFGEFLRHLRRRARLTQRDLGQAVGCSEFGVAETSWELRRFTLSPFDRDMHVRAMTAVHAQLDEATFAAAWAEGKQMPLDKAIEYALADSEI